MRDILFVLLGIIDGLIGVVLSGDMWALAMYSAKDKCMQSGMSEATFIKIWQQLDEYRKERKRANPLSYLHDKE